MTAYFCGNKSFSDIKGSPDIGTVDSVRGETASSNILALLLCLSDSVPEGLDLGKEHDHQSHVFLDAPLQGDLVRQTQPDFTDFVAKFHNNGVEPINFSTKLLVLNGLDKYLLI